MNTTEYIEDYLLSVDPETKKTLEPMIKRNLDYYAQSSTLFKTKDATQTDAIQELLIRVPEAIINLDIFKYIGVQPVESLGWLFYMTHHITDRKISSAEIKKMSAEPKHKKMMQLDLTDPLHDNLKKISTWYHEYLLQFIADNADAIQQSNPGIYPPERHKTFGSVSLGKNSNVNCGLVFAPYITLNVGKFDGDNVEVSSRFAVQPLPYLTEAAE